MDIDITDEAINQLLEKKVDNVRLGVTGGGCAGYEYVFKQDEPTAEDLSLIHI